jgi:hypothetical protein
LLPRFPLPREERKTCGEWQPAAIGKLTTVDIRCSCGIPASHRGLHIVQISRETIFRRRDGIEQHERANLSAVTYAVGDHVHEGGNLLRRSARVSLSAQFSRRPLAF